MLRGPRKVVNEDKRPVEVRAGARRCGASDRHGVVEATPRGTKPRRVEPVAASYRSVCEAASQAWIIGMDGARPGASRPALDESYR